jgi:methylmalonyl-CoA/ethylmalonyl-CoA epimerase
MKIHHIGYLVKDIESAAMSLELLGYARKGDICYDETRDADMLFLENDGYRIELVAPRSESSVAWNLLKKHGNSPYHICYETDNIMEESERLKARGYITLSTEANAPAITEVMDSDESVAYSVAFFMGRDIGMIELVARREISCDLR